MNQAQQYQALVAARRVAVQAEIDYLKNHQLDNDYDKWNPETQSYPEVIFKDGSKCTL